MPLVSHSRQDWHLAVRWPSFNSLPALARSHSPSSPRLNFLYECGALTPSCYLPDSLTLYLCLLITVCVGRATRMPYIRWKYFGAVKFDLHATWNKFAVRVHKISHQYKIYLFVILPTNPHAYACNWRSKCFYFAINFACVTSCILDNYVNSYCVEKEKKTANTEISSPESRENKSS